MGSVWGQLRRRCSATRQAGEQKRRGCPGPMVTWTVLGQRKRAQLVRMQCVCSGQGPFPVGGL